MPNAWRAWLALPALAAAAAAGAAVAQETPHALARAVLKELVDTNTTDSAGDNTAAAEAVARRLRAAGLPAADVEVVVPAPAKGNLVARLRGSGRGRPVLFLAHLDVVEARREDWTLDPFRLVERDGYFYGRGTQDVKGEAALLVANFLRLSQEGFRPDRDLILALTADEEGGRGPNGVGWLLEHRRALIDAEYCANTDGGGGQAIAGRHVLYSMQAAEKGYLTFALRARRAGGHSSQPVPENAIYDLASALLRVRDMRFPVHLNDITRRYFEATALLKSGQEAADRRALAGGGASAADAAARLSRAAYDNALLHTTCVATMLAGGHAENALPQSAEATVNCRVLPGETQAEVESRLRDAVGSGIEIETTSALQPNPVSLPPPQLLARVEAVVREASAVPVVLTMETGGTDGKALRAAGIPTYGLAQMYYDLDDLRMHGRDERIRMSDFDEGLEFGYRLMKSLSRAAEPR
jgi:acetylornithine deacetylase/succinyl-diaminopimelate desuccinylase-like protein